MDISALRERPRGGAMTVSELNDYIKNMFDTSRLLSSVSVCGEISNLVFHRSGHLYFSIKDEGGLIRAVMFRSSAAGLKFIPENGMKVVARGSVSVYTRDGAYQIYVNSMQPDGVGALYLAYEQLKGRLMAEGLFDEYHKKLIPQFPSAIGVITSPTGAAVRDIINILGRRYPYARVYVYPALVQGDGAETSLIRGLDYFDSAGLVDTVIIGRGGGSIEDLWAFNSEALARRIYAMKLPVISAVGHETDFTICDFVSDLRAPTPSAAAELAVPDMRELIMRTDRLAESLDRGLLRTVERARERLEAATRSEYLTMPLKMLESRRERLDSLKRELAVGFTATHHRNKIRYSELIGRLDALNPLSVLARGYSIVESDGRGIRSRDGLAVGQRVTLRFSDGSADAQIIGIEK